jgi:hypothetical protein
MYVSCKIHVGYKKHTKLRSEISREGKTGRHRCKWRIRNIIKMDLEETD